MDPTQYQKFKNIVATALELPSDKVKDFLDEQCANDNNLRHEIELLLNQDMQDDFLEQSCVEVPSKENNKPLLKGQIGRIELDNLIASGGMGEVYAGTDKVLKRAVAVKVIKSGISLSSKGRADFLNEAQILSSLHHPNICQVFDFFEEDGKDILVLELVEGKTLRQILNNKQKIQPLEIAKQIIAALVVAHERGIIHRDLKPDNVMVTDKGIVKILDFGLARFDEFKEAPTSLDRNNNQTQIAGTPGYMSPEQALGKRSTTATDLWSFGVLLCELISGTQPHPKDSTVNELLERTKIAKYEIPSSLGSAETNLIKQLLSAKAKNRPTARSVLNEISRIQGLPKTRFRWFLGVSLFVICLFSIWKYTTDLTVQKDKANLARIEAEKLVNFMLHDLHPQLNSLGKLGLLESASKEVLNYYDNLDPKQSYRTLDKQAFALLKISSVFDAQGEIQKALDTLYKARTLFNQLLIEQPGNNNLRLNHGQTLMNIGELLSITGNYKDSVIEANMAVDISGQLIIDFPPETISNVTPNAHDRWWLHLRSLYLLSDTYRRKGDLNKAIEILSIAMNLAEPALKKLPSLASIYADIIYMQCNTNYQIHVNQEVLDICIKSAKLSEQLYKNKPDDFRSTFVHAIDLGFLANIYRELKQPQKAISTINKAIELSKKLNQWDSDNQTVENDLVSNLNVKGQILYEQGEFQASQVVFEEAYQIIIRLTKDNEELHFAHNKLYTEIYLNKLKNAQVTANFLKSKGMKTRDLLALFTELENRMKNKLNEK